MIGSNAETRLLNNYIHEVTNDLFKIYCDLQSSGELVTAEAIKMKYTGAEVSRRIQIAYFR